MSGGTSDLPGLDLGRLRGYLDATCPGLVDGDLVASLIEGGRSNLTYIVTDGERRIVVRRPPLGHVLATAHDMGRESRVMAALAGSAVPVPPVLAYCDAPEVLGAPFFVMDYVEGTPYRWSGELTPLGADRTAAITHRMVQTLAALHAVDPVDVGLADFGRPQGFLERQVRRWTAQLEASRSREMPGIDELGRRLADSIPPEQPPAIVHGDFRLDNLLVDEADRVAAVVDWEMATLGDPLTDLGLLAVYHRLSILNPILGDAPLAPGFIDEGEMLATYTAAGGRDLADIGFYLGLGSYKLAVILEGIYFRFSQGQTVGGGFDLIGDAVEPIVAAGLESLRP